MVEAVLSIVVLGFSATVVTGFYISGLQALAAQNERALLDSALRSKMEELLSQKFDQLAGGSSSVTVNGQSHTITWLVANVDLDGDTNPESTAKDLNVTLEGRTLTTIVVDNEGLLGKL